MSEPVFKWTDMRAKFDEKGVLNKQFYVVFTSPANGMGPVMENLGEHLAFQESLEAKGIMFAAGPFASDDESTWDGEGMVIIRAGSLDEARQIADSDPMHKSGARTYRLRPWVMNEGSFNLRITYSDGGHEIS